MTRSTSFVHTGRGSAELNLAGSPDETGTRIVGAVQDLHPPRFPTRITGYYFVRDFDRGTPIQYLQAVIIAVGTDLPEFPNHQIRYILTGIDKDPFLIRNARFRFMGPPEVNTGRWIGFELPVADDYLQLWGKIPIRFDTIRVLFEARYDSKAVGAQTGAIVYYDDLSVAY